MTTIDFKSFLTSKRELVIDEYNKVVRQSEMAHIPVNKDMKDYFNTVFNYFMGMSKVKVGKCLRSENYLLSEFWKAIDAANAKATIAFKYEIRNERMRYFRKAGMDI